jgi:SNF2 family DNA or RNA helicase
VKELKEKGLVNKVLVIAPLRVAYCVWPEEVKKWGHLQGLSSVVLHGTKKETLLHSRADIYLVNFEGLGWLLDIEKRCRRGGRASIHINAERWERLGFDMLIVDELTKFKNTGTNRFRALKHVLGSFTYRWGLTGSPLANGLLDMFGQCYVVDEGEALGKYVTHFRLNYCIPSRDGFSYVLKQDAKEKIYKKLQDKFYVIRDEDLKDMPTLIENTIKVRLNSTARNTYKKVEKDLFATLEDGTITAVNAASVTSKCRQISNGAVYIDDEVTPLKSLPTEKRYKIIHDEKLKALGELVEELQGAPILVAYHFRHDLSRIRQYFGTSAKVLGGAGGKNDVALIKAWNDGDVKILLGNPSSIGHGLNLHKGSHHVAWFGLLFDFELYDQFRRRVLRSGNPNNRVYVHHILAEKSIDEVILKSLKIKERRQNELFDALSTPAEGPVTSKRSTEIFIDELRQYKDRTLNGCCQ